MVKVGLILNKAVWIVSLVRRLMGSTELAFAVGFSFPTLLAFPGGESVGGDGGGGGREGGDGEGGFGRPNGLVNQARR